MNQEVTVPELISLLSSTSTGRNRMNPEVNVLKLTSLRRQPQHRSQPLPETRGLSPSTSQTFPCWPSSRSSRISLPRLSTKPWRPSTWLESLSAPSAWSPSNSSRSGSPTCNWRRAAAKTSGIYLVTSLEHNNTHLNKEGAVAEWSKALHWERK